MSAGFGDFGVDLTAARGSEFFAFFNLTPAASPATQDEGVLEFRPASDAMRQRARVRFIVSGERLIGAELHLRRDFISDPELYPFAADIASSFLRAALRGVTEPGAEAAADDIAHYQPRGASARVIARSADALPRPRLGASEQVRTYAGVSGECSATFGHLLLNMSNPLRDGERVFELRVAPAEPAPSLWARLRRRVITLVAPEATLEAQLVALLRRLAADAGLRQRFLFDPAVVMRDCGLDPGLLGAIDPAGDEALPAFLRRPRPD